MKNRIITSEQIESFYRYLCSEERTENTVTKYLRDIAAFREWNGGQEVTKDRVIAYKQHLSDNGVVEAFSHKTLPILCTQFHPDLLRSKKSRPRRVRIPGA